VNYGFMSL